MAFLETYDASELGDLLESAICAEGLTMREAADRFGCSDRHLRRVRKGGYPETAAQWLHKLGYEVTLVAKVYPSVECEESKKQSPVRNGQ